MNPGAGILSPLGDFDISNSELLRTALERAAGEHEFVIVDFTQTTFADSSIITAILRSHNAIASRLRIVAPRSGVVHRVFSLVGIQTVTPLFETLEDAIGRLRSEGCGVEPRRLIAIKGGNSASR